jgi:shikimate dehydrogenase
MRKIVGIIGSPLEHSLSPAMHNAAYKALKIEYEYIPFEVSPADLKEAIKGLRALGLAGFNVTIPHKEAILPLLEEVTKVAKDIGAVNSVVIREGKLVGYNTDGEGFIESLKQDAGFNPSGKKAVILGAGGASRAVAVTLAEAGAEHLTIADMVDNKAMLLSEYLISFAKTNCNSVKMGSSELQNRINAADLLVNATPVGMYPKENESPLAGITLPSKLTVYDLVYNPSQTALLKAAEKAGAKTCSGLGMLVRQGAIAFALFTGEEAPLNVMWKAAENELHRHR